MDQPASHSVEIRNDWSDLQRMSAWIYRTGRLMELPDAVLSDLDLCAAEAVHNVIEHAYDDSACHWIRVRLVREQNHVDLEVEDDGKSFNPLEHPPAPAVASLEQEPLGGRGLLLIRGLTTELTYRRDEGKNMLTMGRAWAP
jgi:serine/threonine-protein kinase RsbW